ncbi:MAG: hypothetical protein KAT75_02890, partial [Dehalococcoidia bacterium]|nr:hypothetical protein [Dehalococcoidia bacterium]
YMFANDQHEASKLLADITGGLGTTVFGYKDWANPEERPYIEKYLAGKAGVPTEHRLRVIRMIKELTNFNHDNTVIHAEGSLAAQKMSMYAAADWERYKAVAKRICSIPGWEKHPAMKDLTEWPAKDVV